MNTLQKKIEKAVDIIDDIIFQEYNHHINKLKPQIKNGLLGLLKEEQAELLNRVEEEVVGFDEGVSNNLIPDPSWEHRNKLRAAQRKSLQNIRTNL